MPHANSLAIAGGAISAALIDVLIGKGIITTVEATNIGHRAQSLLAAILRLRPPKRPA